MVSFVRADIVAQLTTEGEQILPGIPVQTEIYGGFIAGFAPTAPKGGWY